MYPSTTMFQLCEDRAVKSENVGIMRRVDPFSVVTFIAEA